MQLEDGNTSDLSIDEFCGKLENMTKSLVDTRQVVKTLLEKRNTEDFDIKDGISLLSLKNQVMISYIHALTLLSSHRVLGHSLLDRTPPTQPFQHPQREPRGSKAGDLVDSLIEGRVILEKEKVLETRMRYQIDKLVRAAAGPTSNRETEDPLSFRPNPDNFIQPEDEHGNDGEASGADEVYRPPKVAPMPYNEPNAKERRKSKAPATLSSLAYLDPSTPHQESTSGLGGASKRGVISTSSRARELARMTEYEESNMTRLVLNKKEAKRRRQDEENIALGGSGLGSTLGRGRARGAGLADEFGDLLRERDRPRGMADGYEELRARGKKKSAFERSKAREVSGHDHHEEGERPRKRSRFHQELKKFKKRQR
ncbi:hypothetical protein CPB86DRAFT_804857 [Serendipita vermifera]|nr:hypothetical protein CPB86DRAFT_804857 [Serendipita vermifera]